MEIQPDEMWARLGKLTVFNELLQAENNALRQRIAQLEAVRQAEEATSGAGND